MTLLSGFQHPSIADIPESALVERLLGQNYTRTQLISIYGIDGDVQDYQRVALNDLPTSPAGDADILLVPPGHPERTTAIEVKRIKVRGPTANRLPEFRKGVRQANRLATIGFHQVYLYIIVVADTREQNQGRITFEGLLSPLRDQIRQLISTQHLEKRVGLMHYEYVQPMDHEPFGVGTHGGHLVRLAEATSQPLAVTEWVRRATG